MSDLNHLTALRAIAALLPDGPKVKAASAGARLVFPEGDSCSGCVEQIATYLVRELERLVSRTHPERDRTLHEAAERGLREAREIVKKNGLDRPHMISGSNAESANSRLRS